MRKSLSPSPSDSLTPARVFGVPLDEVQQSGQPGQEVPLLVRSIIEYIEEHGGLDLEGLFLVNGNAERVEWLRQRYDSGEEVDLEKEADLASAVSLLRLFLQELPEPIIPAGMQAHILQLYQDYSSEEELARNMKFFLQQLPPVNYSLLRFLCRFLSSVASLQEESWSVGALAAVFGPDIFHLDTDVEDLKEQESVSRILAELLENQEEFFDSEDDDVSTTNDYSSNNEQITELLDDDKLEACEELPQDCEGKDGIRSSSKSPQPDDILAQVAPSSSSHISPITILPGSADLIQRTIRAAVEQHFFDLQTSIDQISSYDNQGPGPSEGPVTKLKPCQGHQEEPLCERGDPDTSPLAAKDALLLSENRPKAQEVRDCDDGAALEESSGMDIEATEALVDAENNINTARKENKPSKKMDQADLITCDSDVCHCDQNANTGSCYASPPVCCPRTNSSLHLSHVFPHCPWEDPVPAFKSWHDESDSGEAQLSPLAGRMVPLPHEEDTHPLMARRFLDFGHSQRFLQLNDHDTTSPTKPYQSLGRPRRASFSSKESGVRNESVSHQLTKKLQNLKKKIKQFEEQFEKDRKYKPSHGDRAANPKVLKWMTDLTKIRKQLKGRQHLFPKGSLRHQAVLQSYRRHHPSSSFSAPNTPDYTHARPHTASRQAPYLYAKQKEAELTPQTRPRSNTLPKSFGSTLDQAGHEVIGEAKGHGPTREETLDLIQHCIKEKREEDDWPEDIKKMTKEQLSCEKTVLQKNLLHYEGLHGRPVTREERLGIKELYDRYRLVKQTLTRVNITPIITSPSSKRRTQTLQPIIEGETTHFCDDIKEEEEEEADAEAEEEATAEEEEESQFEVPTVKSGVIMAQEHPEPSSQRDSDRLYRTSMEETSGKLALDLRLSSSNASSMPELLEQLWKARAEKKKLRKTIREFEDDFYQQNGRNVQKEDRLPMIDEYKEYKRIKAKLRLLEVLISKQDSSKSI
ncbi:hypothetical protein DPEC_G00024070 [Dallia pectoralis]|uniref:Uncharacterized protein n=1 Tax=Dallia pectoralis TaxID=75939 RepID=A0ACC2HGY1_DALPE|nr:hypothetical protein DPEC_G00024070 [Dallia pectoralis]